MPDTVSTLPSRVQIFAWVTDELLKHLPADCAIHSVRLTDSVLGEFFHMHYGLGVVVDGKAHRITLKLLPDSELPPDEGCEAQVRFAAHGLALDISGP